jgi:uncharacterized membrane protein affecting hemolysin expression
MLEPQTPHLFLISTIILLVLFLVALVLLIVLFKQNNELRRMNMIVFENEQHLANQLDEVVNALEQTNNTLIGLNDSKFNIQIKLNRLAIRTAKL